MGLVKTRRLAAMQKQQRAKAAMKPPMKGGSRKDVPRQFATAPKAPLKAFYARFIASYLQKNAAYLNFIDTLTIIVI